MGTKDFDTGENKDPQKMPSGEEQSTAVKPADEKEANQIKNAHATGDGSFGRNDESLPDEEDNSKIKNTGSDY